MKINIKEINKYEREIRMVEEKDLQAAGAFQEEEENGWKNRVEKVNATRRRIVCTYARSESSEEALRLVGESRRRPNREKERFLRKRTEKTATRRKAVFHIPRAKESNRIKETGARSSLLFREKIDSFLKKNSLENSSSSSIENNRSKRVKI